MPALTISLEGDKSWPDLKDRPFIHLAEGAPPIQVAVLDGGMTSGLPSVAIRLDLPDGRVVVAETSARLFVTAAREISARYPKLFDD